MKMKSFYGCKMQLMALFLIPIFLYGKADKIINDKVKLYDYRSDKNSIISYEDTTSVVGVVMDSLNKPLPGVTITVVEKNYHVVTDALGRFSIPIEPPFTVKLSAVGFENKEITVTSKSFVTIKMLSKVSSLGDVVITALGIRQRKNTLSYSTQSVPVEQIAQNRDLNMVNSLSGKIAGANISQSSTGVGGASRVVLRGNRSINGDNQPLYVVDGVPILGNPQDINPDDIESVNILTGPNSAAVYGSSAQNGVIIMTTKKGRIGNAGKVKFGFTTSDVLSQPEISLDLQNQYGQGDAGVYSPSSIYSWGPLMTGQSVATWSQDPAKSSDTYSMSPQPNNVKDLFDVGYTTANNIQATVNGRNSAAFISLTYTKAKGIIPTNTLDKKNFLVGYTSKLTDKLTFNTKINYLYSFTDNPVRTSATKGSPNFNPVEQIYTIPRNIRTQDLKQYEYFDESLGYMTQDYWSPGTPTTAENPYWVLNRELSNIKEQRWTSYMSLQYDFTKEFNLMIRGSYDREDFTNEEKDYDGTFVRDPYGYYSKELNNAYLYTAEFLFSYNHNFLKHWNIDAHLGGMKKSTRDEALTASTGTALLIPNYFDLSNTELPVVTSVPGTPIDNNSFYAFGKISWNNAIFMDLSGRNDWSSTLPAGHRSYFYPSIGLSAELSQLVNLPAFISSAQLRSSWAKVGNSPDAFMLERTATFSAGGNNGFLSLSNILPNSYLKPEYTESFESGLNVKFFNNRLGIDFTYYNTDTKNQLFTVALPVGSGAGSFYTNGGDVQNRGIEILMNVEPVKTNNFSWDVSVNFSHYSDKVLKISDERPKVIIGTNGYMNDYVVEQGKPFGEIYTVGFLRDDQGNVIVSSNGVPEVTSDKSINAGTFTPDWRGGLNMSFAYKSLRFSFLIDHRQGGKVASYTEASLSERGLSKNTLQGRDGSLVFGKNFLTQYKSVKEDGSVNDIPVSAETFWEAMGNTSVPVGELFTESATNMRLREASLTYSFPARFVQKLNLQQASLSIVGRNLFFIYRKDKNFDPDMLDGTSTQSEGFSSFTLPTTRNIGLTLNIGF